MIAMNNSLKHLCANFVICKMNRLLELIHAQCLNNSKTLVSTFQGFLPLLIFLLFGYFPIINENLQQLLKYPLVILFLGQHCRHASELPQNRAIMEKYSQAAENFTIITSLVCFSEVFIT